MEVPGPKEFKYTLPQDGESLPISRVAALRREIDALESLVEGDADLFNPYSVIVVSPAKFPHLNVKLAARFAEFIRSAEGQAIIRDYGKDKFGAPLFFPDVVK